MITDEEIAEIERRREHCIGPRGVGSDAMAVVEYDVPRLIEALKSRSGDSAFLVSQANEQRDTATRQLRECLDSLAQMTAEKEALRADATRVIAQLTSERDEARLNALAAIEETGATYERETKWHAMLVRKRKEAEAERDAANARAERAEQAYESLIDRIRSMLSDLGVKP